MLYSTVALSVIFSFISTELTGILTGGMISAGYLAFWFQEPMRILSTLLMSVLIALILKGSRHFLILYGRRRFMLSVLLSIFGVYMVEKLYFYISFISHDMRIIGYIIPGLIASDMDKQGIFRTLVSVSVIALIVRMFMLLGASI